MSKNKLTRYQMMWNGTGMSMEPHKYGDLVKHKDVAAFPEMIDALKLAAKMPESYDINYAQEIIQTVRDKAKAALEKAGQL